MTPEELHHHDVVHYALNETKQDLANGKGYIITQRLKDHLVENKARREQKQTSPSTATPAEFAYGQERCLSPGSPVH